jgi:rod shape-determining protein MreD
MAVLSFAGALAVAALLHLAGTWLFPGFPRLVDLFLVTTVAAARSGRPERALVAGSVAGWVEDALMGGPFGLFGFTNAAVGYLTALVAQRLVVQRQTAIAGVFAAAGAAQGMLLTLLGWAIVGGREMPHPLDLVLRVATTAAAGLAWTQIGVLVARRFRRLRHRPSGSLRIDRSLLP